MNRSIATFLISGLALTGALSGCAQPTTSFMPSASVRTESTVPAGVWRGRVEGHDIGDAEGEEPGNADLTIAPDGTFTLELTFDSLQGLATSRATGTARMKNGRIVLDGHLAAPEARKGEPFTTTLQPRGQALYGVTDVLYRGVKSGATIELRRVS